MYLSPVRVILQTVLVNPSQGEVEGVQGFFNCNNSDLELDQLQGDNLTWWKEQDNIFCHRVSTACSVYESTGKISVLALNDVAGLHLVGKGLPPHTTVVHVCPFPLN